MMIFYEVYSKNNKKNKKRTENKQTAHVIIKNP